MERSFAARMIKNEVEMLRNVLKVTGKVTVIESGTKSIVQFKGLRINDFEKMYMNMYSRYHKGNYCGFEMTVKSNPAQDIIWVNIV